MVTVLDGVAAGGGIAIAPVYRLGESRFTVKAKYTDNVNHEVSRLHDSFSGVMSLGVGQNADVTITAEGDDEAKAIEAIAETMTKEGLTD